MEIVARGGCLRRVAESSYLVRSQNGNGWYKINWKRGKWICACPDYEKRNKSCKHIYAVIFLLRLPQILLANPLREPSRIFENADPKTLSVQGWNAG
jgi:hypothetical protein